MKVKDHFGGTIVFKYIEDLLYFIIFFYPSLTETDTLIDIPVGVLAIGYVCSQSL